MRNRKKLVLFMALLAMLGCVFTANEADAGKGSFVDSDGDGIVDSNDLCPFDATNTCLNEPSTS